MRYEQRTPDRYLDFFNETLEDRQMLAGDVEVVARHGDVVVTGDNASNQVRVDTFYGQIRVTGINGTRVNGVTNGVSYQSISDDLKINLKHGDNQLTLGSEAMMLNIPDDLSVRTGNGADEIEAPNVFVGDDASFSMGHGFNQLRLSETGGYGYSVSDDLKISSPGATTVIASWGVVDDTRISTGHMNDVVLISETALAGSISISTKGGNDTIAIFDTVLGGNLKVSAAGGGDSFTFGGADAAAYGDIRLAMGHGNDSAVISATLSSETDVFMSGV